VEQITISGHSFNVPVRYEEGHELTAGEASALNQTYHENLRNNFAKKVKDAGDGADVAALQAELAAKTLLGRPEGAQIMEVAKARVEEQKSLASSNLGDLLSGLTTKAPDAAVAPDGTPSSTTEVPQPSQG
jgi:hypothetical protein